MVLSAVSTVPSWTMVSPRLAMSGRTPAEMSMDIRLTLSSAMASGVASVRATRESPSMVQIRGWW